MSLQKQDLFEVAPSPSLSRLSNVSHDAKSNSNDCSFFLVIITVKCHNNKEKSLPKREIDACFGHRNSFIGSTESLHRIPFYQFIDAGILNALSFIIEANIY